VEPRFHSVLLGMGFSAVKAQWALRNQDNRISDSLQFLEEHPVDDADIERVSSGN